MTGGAGPAEAIEPAEPGKPAEALEEVPGEGEPEFVGQFVLVVDPAWEPASPDDEPPAEAVVGGWYFDDEGEPARFQANPAYRPSRPGSPTDPVDAEMQQVVRGGADGSTLIEVMRDAVFGVALDEEGLAIVAPAPDNVPSVLVTTAAVHRERVQAADWAETGLAEIVEALPDSGVDVLLNPGAPASMRLEGAILKRALAEGDDES